MSKERLIIPNDANGFIVDELRERLRQGGTVTIAFGGSSMMPLIDGRSDLTSFEMVGETDKLRVGEVYLFVYHGMCVIHRLMRTDGSNLVFRGDNNINDEHVDRKSVLARLVSVRHADGSVISCDSDLWRRASRRVVRRRTLLNMPFKMFGRRQRRWERWLYFVFLLLLMWAPVGVLGIPLDNFVFGLRLDHLLHASIYIPCVFFLMDFALFRERGTGRLRWSVWPFAVLIGIVTETVQYFLPYRGFDINDLVANFMGVTLGYLLLRLLRRS